MTKSGLKAGDILLAIDKDEIADLRALMIVLSRRAPRDTIEITVRRDSEVVLIPAVLGVRYSGEKEGSKQD